jgi:predicted lactoylglutathione lyase
MAKMIFVNLPVTDVARATAFYEAIGFEKNAKFSNEQASSMMWSDSIVFMLLSKPFYSTFTDKQIADANAVTTGHYALLLDSKADVDAIAAAAVKAGGREVHGAEDMGFMYSRAFEDLDGHGFGPLWMDPAAAEQGPPEHEPIAD